MKQSALIICSRNRQEELSEVLNSIDCLADVPATTIIVDSSEDTSATVAAVGERNLRRGRSIYLVHSQYGLPHQRNIGIHFLTTLPNHKYMEFVFFLDDDVRVGQDYFSKAQNFLRQNQKVVAVGPANLAEHRGRPRLLRFLLGEPGDEGRIGPSGLVSNVSQGQGFIETDWIAGGGLILRAELLKTFRFDGKRRMHGEDVEASLRLSKLGVIGVLRELAYSHSGAKTGKLTHFWESYFSDSFRLELATKASTKVRKSRVVLASIMLFFGEAFSISDSKGGSLGHLRFILDVIFDKVRFDRVPWGWNDPAGFHPGSYTLEWSSENDL